MDEIKPRSIRWVRVLGILLQIGSVIAIFALAHVCLRQGDKDYLLYDQVKRVLIPPKNYANICAVIFWVGFAGGMMVFAHEILKDADPVSKGIGAVLGIAGFLATIFLNAFVARSMYVDEGLGFQPEYEISGDGDEFFLIVRCKEWQTVQVYFISENMAFWVDGYDTKEPDRQYTFEPNPNGFLEDRLIKTWKQGEDFPNVDFISLFGFPEEYLNDQPDEADKEE